MKPGKLYIFKSFPGFLGGVLGQYDFPIKERLITANFKITEPEQAASIAECIGADYTIVVVVPE